MDNRVGFLQWILGETEGFIAIGFKNARSGDWTETIFDYPAALDDVEQYIKTNFLSGDIYFCPTVLTEPRRVKANIHTSEVIWSDLDECEPIHLRVKPTIVVETSPGRWQGFWKLKQTAHALDVEAINYRIAYAHEELGADTSGWDLTQYLRVPGTKNHKRLPNLTEVKVLEADTELAYELSDFDVYPVIEGSETVDVPFPTAEELPDISGPELMESIKTTINPRAWQLFTTAPKKDWSKNLWQLELMLFDINCTREEVFVIARDSATNKYERDGNSNMLLWKDVCRAHDHVANRAAASLELNNGEVDWHLPDRDLLTDSERALAATYRTIIDDYGDWAESVGDAAPQYHVAGAFVALSSLIASSVRLPTSYGVVLPNMWFMILADTTLTRKTTAMDLAMDMVIEVDPDVMLATDGSIEGLMTSIGTRPNRASVFLRDEFSGLLEAMAKKDYYAGMLETFTKLYDGKYQKRVLRKEIIEIRDPVLVMFAGGIKNRIYELLNYNHINSGFIPRFCFITASSDLDRVRPLGPPTRATSDGREALVTRFRDLYVHYTPGEVTPDNLFPKSWDVTLEPEAWIRYNQLEADMLAIGIESSMADIMTPMMARLTTSGLKAAVLIAASQRLSDSVEVTVTDLIKAFSYVESWKSHAIQVVANAGKTANEKLMERIYNAIAASEKGMPRGILMQQYRLNARDANNVFETLEQRGLIRGDKQGRAVAYIATRTTKVKEKK